MSPNLVALLYLVAGVLFILSLRGLSSPETSRRGNYLGMTGMAIAVFTTLAVARETPLTWAMIVIGIAIGGGIGALVARRIPMTAMPELVAAFHSPVGVAAVLVAAAAAAVSRAFSKAAFGSKVFIGLPLQGAREDGSTGWGAGTHCAPQHKCYSAIFDPGDALSAVKQKRR
jgi:H+-translocating NAD(P) transhydrogenase subunit beta